MSRETISLDEFHVRLKAQSVSSRLHAAFKCPACGTVQSGRSLIDAGAGETFDSVERYVAGSCIGRFNGAGSADFKNRSPAPGKQGCNWTLGGLLQIHELVVQTPDGDRPCFVVATPEEAQALEAAQP